VRAPSERRRPAGRDGADAAATALSLLAYAKVNLSLEVLGKRPDGFHEIVSVAQIVSLADRIILSPGEPLSIEMVPPLVTQAENLVGRAANALAAETGRTPVGSLHIRKQIPLAAGLGGGSSDAAATLRLLDRLWRTRLGPRRLAGIAATLGSDVPLFLGSGTSLVRGRGEIVQSLASAPPFWLVLVCTGGAPTEKTRALYGSLSPDDYGSGATTLALAAQLGDRQPVADAALVNSFDAAASRVYPGFTELRRRLCEEIGRPVHLTGAGPTLFAVFTDAAEARQAAGRVSRLGLRALVARSIARRPPIRLLPVQGSSFDRSP
jgi:4-diphosphocytidyl-2-C-methyl-D-erythritol kinase